MSRGASISQLGAIFTHPATLGAPSSTFFPPWRTTPPHDKKGNCESETRSFNRPEGRYFQFTLLRRLFPSLLSLRNWISSRIFPSFMYKTSAQAEYRPNPTISHSTRIRHIYFSCFLNSAPVLRASRAVSEDKNPAAPKRQLTWKLMSKTRSRGDISFSRARFCWRAVVPLVKRLRCFNSSDSRNPARYTVDLKNHRDVWVGLYWSLRTSGMSRVVILARIY